MLQNALSPRIEHHVMISKIDKYSLKSIVGNSPSSSRAGKFWLTLTGVTKEICLNVRAPIRTSWGGKQKKLAAPYGQLLPTL